MLGGVEPAEGGLEVPGVESGAAGGGMVASGSEVEEDAGAEAGDAIGIVGDDGAPLIEFGVLNHCFVTDPVAADLAVIDDLVVVFGGAIVDADGVLSDGGVGKEEVGGVNLRGDAEGLSNGEEAGRAAVIAFGFDGEVWRWRGAMEASAPGEAGAAKGGGEGSLVEGPGAAIPNAFEEPGLGAGGIGGGRENEEELVAEVGDIGGEGAGEAGDGAEAPGGDKADESFEDTGKGARHAVDKGEGIRLGCKHEV